MVIIYLYELYKIPFFKIRRTCIISSILLLNLFIHNYKYTLIHETSLPCTTFLPPSYRQNKPEKKEKEINKTKIGRRGTVSIQHLHLGLPRWRKAEEYFNVRRSRVLQSTPRRFFPPRQPIR